jgi:ABC-type uncharacterized transport system substrate-binding protein
MFLGVEMGDSDKTIVGRARAEWGPLCLVVLIAIGYATLKLQGGRFAPRAIRAGDSVYANVDSAAKPRVLLVHSYHPGYSWVDAVNRGVRMALSGSAVDLQITYMDTKRNTDEAFKRRAGQTVREIADEWQPAVIVAADDNAQEYFAARYAAENDVQVVFCGVNAEPAEYGYPTANVTGVLARPLFKKALALLHELIPDARRIAVVSDDSPTSAGGLLFMDEKGTGFQVVSKDLIATFAQWKDRVRELQSEVDIIAVYVYHTLKEAGGVHNVAPQRVMEWTVDHSCIPVIGFFPLAADDGALCGHFETGVEHGLLSGRMVLEILGGKKAGEIEMVTAMRGRSMLNLRTAEKFGLSVPDSLIKRIEVLVED